MDIKEVVYKPENMNETGNETELTIIFNNGSEVVLFGKAAKDKFNQLNVN